MMLWTSSYSTGTFLCAIQISQKAQRAVHRATCTVLKVCESMIPISHAATQYIHTIIQTRSHTHTKFMPPLVPSCSVSLSENNSKKPHPQHNVCTIRYSQYEQEVTHIPNSCHKVYTFWIENSTSSTPHQIHETLCK